MVSKLAVILPLFLCLSTAAEAGVIVRFQGNILGPPSIDGWDLTGAFEMILEVDNGGDGSLISQEWTEDDLQSFDLQSGSYAWTEDSVRTNFFVRTGAGGVLTDAFFGIAVGELGGDTLSGTLAPQVRSLSGVAASDGSFNEFDSDTINNLAFRGAVEGWSVDSTVGVVPEPTSLAVWALGLIGGVGWRRRRRS